MVTEERVPVAAGTVSEVPRRRASISAVVICGNEEAGIRECLASVAWCDEIVVVDSLSTDRTVEIARTFTPRVFERAWPGYVAQKNFALEQATQDWVLSLDADEVCTPALRAEIERALENPDEAAAFRVRRLVHYLGRWIRHCGWYPDWKTRLVRRGRARWEGVDPHDKLVVDGPVRELPADLHHFTYKNFSHQIRTIDHFGDVAVEQTRVRGRTFSWWMLLFHPPVKFLEVYVRKLGVLDGMAGFIIAVASSFYVFTKHVKLWEAENRSRMRPPPA